MELPALDTRIQRAVHAFMPDAIVRRVWPLLGGNSACVLACDVELPGGTSKRYVIRTPSDYRRGRHADAASREYSVIQSMHAAGLPVQRPCFLEVATDEHAAPFYVVEYGDGAPELAPADVDDYLKQYATRLAEVHQVRWQDANLAFLPKVELGTPDDRSAGATRMRVDDIRKTLKTPPVEAHANPHVLCHGDFWPGNLLWRDGKLVTIIDWEESTIGEPLFDLAICRLDLLWILGEGAVERFTQIYQARTGFDLFNLPYWDLIVSLRPISGIENWAKQYPHLGRSDVTCETMIAGHQLFVERALTNWPSRASAS
jgi:aminoglycoside phosphotransferase (APT) family kinase protein